MGTEFVRIFVEHTGAGRGARRLRDLIRLGEARRTIAPLSA
jgi:hypothetical protein